MQNSLLHLSPHTKNHTNSAQVDWNKVASIIDYGSAKSASTRFGIIRKRWGSTKSNKPAHVLLYAGKVTKTRAPGKKAASRASSAKPAASTKKSVNGKGSVGGKGKKLPQKSEDDDNGAKFGRAEVVKDLMAPSDDEEDPDQVKDLMAPSDDEHRDAEYNAPSSEKRIRNLMAPSDEQGEEESFQSQVNRGLYDDSNAEEDEGNLPDGAIELLNCEIAQHQEAQLQARLQ